MPQSCALVTVVTVPLDRQRCVVQIRWIRFEVFKLKVKKKNNHDVRGLVIFVRQDTKKKKSPKVSEKVGNRTGINSPIPVLLLRDDLRGIRFDRFRTFSPVTLVCPRLFFLFSISADDSFSFNFYFLLAFSFRRVYTRPYGILFS